MIDHNTLYNIKPYLSYLDVTPIAQGEAEETRGLSSIDWATTKRLLPLSDKHNFPLTSKSKNKNKKQKSLHPDRESP